MSGVLKYCLQMSSIACANERIPRRARKSAFLDYTLAGNSLLPRWCTQKVFRTKTFRINFLVYKTKKTEAQ